MPLGQAALLVGGLVSALVLRLALAGTGGETSIPAALAFSAALAALALASGWRPRFRRLSRQLALGLAGAAVLCLQPVLHAAAGPLPSLAAWQGFPRWAAAVCLVASCEELLFRGALYDVLSGVGGETAAVVLCALLFAGMHVVLGGGPVFLLDLAAGVWFGVLRMLGGSVAAPLAAHVLADLAAWWLR